MRGYKCPECGFIYEEKNLADLCEAWCREHKSCNLEIINKAIGRSVRKIYDKLVRDLIPEIITQNGGDPKISILDDNKFRAALTDKLIEEASEVKNAEGKDELIEELADVLEIIETLAAFYGGSIKEVSLVKEMKKSKRGGFDKKLFLEYVDEAEWVENK